MSFLKQFDRSKIPRSRVELHLHLDGSVRIETVWELAKKRGIDLGVPSLAELRRKLIQTDSRTLKHFLDLFAVFTPTFTDDLEAVERISYELCEDQARDGVAYFETRLAPHLLVTPSRSITPRQVLQAVLNGLRRGEQDFNIKARTILCCVFNNDEWAKETLKMCEEYQNSGVVGIDIAKDETIYGGFTPTEIQVYERAAHLGINRTAHAGESGSYNTVLDAMTLLRCSRVGHGYRVFQDTSGSTYQMAREVNLHFEACPYSSVLTGGCPLSSQKHSIVRFAEDGANFSINKDDTTVTGSTLDDEYRFLTDLGLTESHIIRANMNAALSCFLPHTEKEDLISELAHAYGFPASKAHLSAHL
ncbi:adenosine deaminase-like [Ornithodoros turicata]|uniref:adenosine deaminase-like n=1 Tax=Ornithodoros turicata TaxID=34597 RepID=UPI00313A1A09